MHDSSMSEVKIVHRFSVGDSVIFVRSNVPYGYMIPKYVPDGVELILREQKTSLGGEPHPKPAWRVQIGEHGPEFVMFEYWLEAAPEKPPQAEATQGVESLLTPEHNEG
jgi:hypothetical protein